LGADFLAYTDPDESEAQRSLMGPQPIHWFDGGSFRPYVHPLKGMRDPVTFKRVYAPDASVKIPVKFFGRGFSYKFLGLLKSDIHLLAVEGAKAGVPSSSSEPTCRDAISGPPHVRHPHLDEHRSRERRPEPFPRSLPRWISGTFGGILIRIIQRIIEILRSIPSIPLWMGSPRRFRTIGT
jgi:peptide/nickel transport system permease protein